MQPYSASPQGGHYQAPHDERNHAGANPPDAPGDTRHVLWGLGPSVFIPTFGGIPQAFIDEHDQCLKLLVGPTPLQVQVPPIVNLPTPGGEEERKLFRDVCLHMASYLDPTRKAVILQQEPHPDEAANLMHLAMSVFHYPPRAQTAIELFGKLIARMLQFFSQWWRADSRITEKIKSSQHREQRAANLKKQALAILRVNLQLNPDSKWLFTLLRTLGHFPELWERPNLRPDPNAEAPQALALGMSNSQYAQAARPMHGVPRGPQTPTAAPFPAPVSAPDNFYAIATPVRHDVPSAFQPRTAAQTSQPQPAPSWGQGAPSAPYPTVSEDWQQSQFSQRQPAPLVIPEVPMQGLVNTPASTPAMPTFPSNVHNTRQDAIANPQFMLHRGGSGSLRSVNSYSSRESNTQAAQTSSPRPRQPPDLDALIELERVRLLQMECQLEKIKHLAELFFRALYLELSRYFTRSQLSSVYRDMIPDVVTTLDSIAMQMYGRLTRDLAFLSKYV